MNNYRSIEKDFENEDCSNNWLGQNVAEIRNVRHTRCEDCKEVVVYDTGVGS